jgi:hypothetical protein
VATRVRRVHAAALRAALALTCAGAADGQPPPTALPEARTIIQRHIDAVGGRDAILRLRSRYVWARMVTPARGVSATMELYAARPNRRVVRVTRADVGAEVIGFDGQTAWRGEPGARPVRVVGRELVQLRDEAVYDTDLYESADFPSVETVERVAFERRPCYKLRVVSASQRESFEFFDAATGLFAGRIGQWETEQGPVTVKRVVSRYKTFDGVRIATQVSVRRPGLEDVITIAKVEHNRVPASVFERPASLRSPPP